MKHVLLKNNKGCITTVADAPISSSRAGTIQATITDEQAATVAAGLASNPKVFYFLRNGALLTYAQAVASDDNRTYTAEDYLKTVGFGGERQPTLIYLLLQLNGANKSSTKLNQAQSWLSGILATYAGDLQLRTSAEWGAPPHTFEAVIQDAMTALAS
jgi:hypothetical protein